jgi:diguanylate cyclase (GGDEF)-like protein/PAS domain S-box-containing protein
MSVDPVTRAAWTPKTDAAETRGEAGHGARDAWPASEQADPPRRTGAGVAPVTGWRRMRVAVYVSFAAIAVNAGLQSWQTQRMADARTLDAEIVDAAGRYNAMVQRVGRLSALIAGQGPGSEPWVKDLSGELLQSHDQALKVHQLASRLDPAATLSGGILEPAFEAWQGARERLWYRAEALLSHAENGRFESVVEANRVLQADADRAGHAAVKLTASLRSHSSQLLARSATAARVGVGMTFGLLAMLALLVVAPGLRALQAQARRLALQAAENERLALVAEHTGNLVVMTDAQRRVVWANEAFTRVAGYELHDVLGQRPGEFLQSQRTDPATVQRMRTALEAGEPVRVELLNRSRDGRDYWIDADIQPLHDAAGTLTGFIAVETVITEQVTDRLRAAALLAALPTAVVVHDRHGTVSDVNLAASRLLGLRVGDMADALMGRRPLTEEMHPMSAEELPVQRTLLAGQGEWGQVIGLDDDEGGRRWLLSNTEPLRDALGAPSGAVACYVDVTERRELLDELRDAARRDALTRMPNRSVVLERVQRAIDHHRRHPSYGFAVLFMDVDRFKQVNDTLGHSAGDDLLRQVAARLNETLRPGDAVARIGSDVRLAARIGGDEFVIVLEGVSHVDAACQVADRLLHELSQPYQLGLHAVHVSVSIGIVSAEQAGEDAGAVLRDCDTAMYEAKRAGRGRWMLFDPSMHERVKATLEMEGELRRALDQDELYVVYQPVVAMSDETLVGVEALVRWRHPERGEIPPGAFIGLAEECGLIDAIGDVVLAKACAQFALWQQQWGQQAPPLLAVNLSRAQLKQPGLVPEVMAVLEANGMRPDQLQLEVTESFAAQDEQVQVMLRALKAAGVRLALDDFGTGYSSLACLHQLPVDTVKIDRSFVACAHAVEYHRVLISATIRVARTLGMTTVAEGIETREQADLMSMLACDRGQGWLFGRPMTPEAMDLWLETHASDSLV